MFLFSFIIPILLFLLEIWPRLKNRYFGIDTWRHLMYADFIRRHKTLPHGTSDRYIVQTNFGGYPPVILLILSLFPKKFADKYQFIFMPFFDAVNNLLVFFSATYLTNNMYIGIISQIIASTIPLAVMEASNLSTRTLSYLVFNLSFFSLILWAHGYSSIFLAATFIFLFILFFTHRFAIQAYLFLCLGFSFIEHDLRYILFFLGTFLVVFLVGGKIYRSVLLDHLGMLNYWRKRIDMRFIHQIRGPYNSKTVSDFVTRIYLLSTKNSVAYVLGNNPWLGAFAAIFLLNLLYLHIPMDNSFPLILPLTIWILITTVVALLVLTVKQLRFIGEGHRYLEYGFFPLAISLGEYIYKFMNINFVVTINPFIIFVLALLLCIVFIQYKSIILDRTRTITPTIWRIIKYVNIHNGKQARLAVFPFNLGDAFMYFLDGSVLTTDNHHGLLALDDVFPYVKKPMREIVKKYRLNYIVIDTHYVTLKELHLKRYKVIIQEDDYLLINVD